MNNKKSAKWKYFYMLMLFLWCAYTAPFLKPFDTNYLVFSAIHIILFAIYYVKFCKRGNQKPIIILFFVFTVWYISQCIKHGGIVGMDFRLLYSIILCHITFFLYHGKEFFIYFEKVLLHLTLLSLIVWIMAIFLPGFTYSFFNSFSVWDNGNTTYGNLIVVALGDQFSMGVLRNIGFTWEAGRFASFLVIGIFFNLILHEMTIFTNKRLWIFVIGLISTLSTTGIGALLGVVFLYLYNKSKRAGVVTIFICILVFPALWSLDFIGGKILDNNDVTQEMSDISYSFDHGDEVITPQRITGLFLEFQNWIHDFWFGYNLNKYSYSQAVLFNGNELWLSNGILQILSKYGTLLGGIFYYFLFASSKQLMNDFGYKGKYLFAFIFILISVSYDFWSSGIFLHIILYSLYIKYMPQISINKK